MKEISNEEFEDMCNTFTEYYKELFRSHESSEAFCISKERKLRLRRAIYETVQGFEPLNAPAPNGYKDEDFDY